MSHDINNRARTAARSVDRALRAFLFYDAGGELVYVKQGVYASEEDLAGDIAKYALTS